MNNSLILPGECGQGAEKSSNFCRARINTQETSAKRVIKENNEMLTLSRRETCVFITNENISISSKNKRMKHTKNKRMKHIIFSILVILTISFGAVNAQNLHHGGKPKLFESKGGIRAYEVKFPNGVTVRKFDRKTEDDSEGFFEISRDSKALGEIPGAVTQAASIDKFDAFWGDLDKNGSAELVVVDLIGESMGMGIDYYSVSIFPDFETKGWQEPLEFSTEEFGARGTFVYEPKTNETLILITDFNGLDNISPKKQGTYFVGRFFRYSGGELKPALDMPIYARRYLRSFEKYRFATEDDPRRPWLWLDSPQAQKLKIDPEFSLKPLTSETGRIERVETIIRRGDDTENPQEYKLVQIVVRMDSGATKIIGLWGANDGEEKEDEKGKILPEIFGIAPANISFPDTISPLDVWEKLEGKKVILNSYAPFSFDERKRTRYKLLFLQ